MKLTNAFASSILLFLAATIIYLTTFGLGPESSGLEPQHDGDWGEVAMPVVITGSN